MRNNWSTHTLSANNPLLKRIGAEPGEYQIKWDKGARVLRIKNPRSGQHWQIPLASASDAISLMALGSKTRDDLSPGETKFLGDLSDRRYNNYTRWKQSNYEVKTKTDSTGFVKDILIRRVGTTDDNHIHIYTDPVTGEQGTHLTIVRNRRKSRYPINGNKSIDELIDEFTE